MYEDNWKRYSRFLADRVFVLMRSQHLTQTALARKMNRTQQYVSHVLNGRENLTLETIFLLGQALGTDLMRELFLEPCAEDFPKVLEDSETFQYGSGYSSSLTTLRSAGIISRCFETGDRPFLVACDDSQSYLCKAARYGEGSHSLARELIGTSFANIWGLADAPMALIRIQPQHSVNISSDRNYELPCLGRLWIEDSVEVRDKDHSYIRCCRETVERILKIALFDLWLSNEDRLTNNLNILYSFKTEEIYAIDHAGIFNTGFSAPLLQLSIYDSILYSGLFEDVSAGMDMASASVTELKKFFDDVIQRCSSSRSRIRRMIPMEWKIDESAFNSLMDFVFSERWLKSVFSNFEILLKSRLK